MNQRQTRIGGWLVFLLLWNHLAVHAASPENDSIASRLWVELQMGSMSLKQKIGQLFVYPADLQSKRYNPHLITHAVAEYGVGGVCLVGTDATKQIQLVNEVQELAAVPLWIAGDGAWGMESVPASERLPETALASVSRPGLKARYEQEMIRQYRLLGVNAHYSKNKEKKADMKGFPELELGKEFLSAGKPEGRCLEAFRSTHDLFLAPGDLKAVVNELLRLVRLNRISQDEIQRRCERVLLTKFKWGITHRPEPVAFSALAQLNTPETQVLRQRLVNASTVVLKNNQHAVPLNSSLSGTVLLSIANQPSAAYPLYKALRDVMQISWVNAHPDSLAAVQSRLIPAQQVIVSIHTPQVTAYRDFLTRLGKDKPVVWASFAGDESIRRMMDAYATASAVMLVREDSPATQEYVAGILLGKERVDGKLPVALGASIPAGTGVSIDPNHPRSYTPEEVGMRSEMLAEIDSIAAEGVREKAFPGCRILILRNGLPIYNKSFGRLDYDTAPRVRENTRYDLSELTETTATLLAAMKLYDEGRYGLTDAIKKWLPELNGTPVGELTMGNLLFHDSGFPSTLPFYETAIDPSSVRGGMYRKTPDNWHRLQVGKEQYVNTSFHYAKDWVMSISAPGYSLQVADSLFLKDDYRLVVRNRLMNAPLKKKNGKYSSLDFILLKEVLETIQGKPLEKYLEETFYGPMGLMNTGFLPLRESDKTTIAPTVAYDFLRKGVLQGYVYNHEAAFQGGISGNAGLFSTAAEVAKIYQMYLNKGVLGDRRYLSRATCALFQTARLKGSANGLGFMHPGTEGLKNLIDEELTSPQAFEQNGETGTFVWADPDRQLLFVFLSNRTYPNAYEQTAMDKLDIIRRMQRAMYQSVIQ